MGEILKINYSLEELNLEGKIFSKLIQFFKLPSNNVDNNIGNKGIKYLNEAIQINNSLQKLSIKCKIFFPMFIEH